MFGIFPSIAHGRRMLSYLKPHLASLALAALSMLLVTGIHLVRPLILRELIDNALPRADAGLALRLGLLFVGVLAIGAGALYGRAVLLARVATRTMARLKEDLLGHLLGQGMAFFDKHAPGKLISRVENDIEQMRGLVSGASAQLAANSLLLVAITGMIWYQEPAIGRWLVGALLVCGLGVILYAGFIRGLYREVRERDSEMASRLTSIGVLFLSLRFPIGFGRLRLTWCASPTAKSRFWRICPSPLIRVRGLLWWAVPAREKVPASTSCSDSMTPRVGVFRSTERTWQK